MRGALAALVLAALLAVGCADDERRRAQPAEAGWTAYRDPEHRFSVRFPSGWARAWTSLTPHLADPREILAVGTGPLVVPAAGRCAHQPVGALDALGPRDAFVTIQERRGEGGGYPTRPAGFALDGDTRSGALACATDPERLRTWWMPFSDRGRSFYALVAVGRDAPPARREQARRILDGLRFAPGGEREGG